MKEKISAESIYREYKKGVSYNTSLELYETIRKNENFYIGKQWEGLNAPDLAKPVINVLKRVVSYFISMIVADDVTAKFTPFKKTEKNELAAKALNTEVARVIEEAELKALSREALRDAAVDGDGAIYFYYDVEEKRVAAEVIEASCVHFGNPYVSDIKSQPYIIISTAKTLSSVRDEAKMLGLSEDKIAAIVPDEDENRYDVRGYTGDERVTVLLRLWRENGLIYAAKSTRNIMLKGKWCTCYTRYPVAILPWEKVKNSCRGNSAISAMIPNQIAINQLFAMAIHHVKTMAFPKIIYDASKIDAWSNKVGQAIGTHGNPNDAVATGFRAPDMSAQVMQLIEVLTQKTLEFMGASDAALGNITPNNTSAIIATQKASAMPLELQRLAFYRFTEDYVRIITDIMCVHYGSREVSIDGESMRFDFDLCADAELRMQVDVGAATYWSELMQMQTLDNLFTRGIVSDAVTYLESVPERYISGKQMLIEKLKEKAEPAAAPAAGEPVEASI